MSPLQHGLTPKMKPIPPRRSAVVCALDIGTSKIACLIGRLKPCGAQEALRRRTHAVEVLGIGHTRARGIKSGTVAINTPYTAFPGMPFGGYKQSGFGRELGLETLELYLETKSVLVSTSPKPFNPFGL